jgi:hypothetical protein
MLNVADLRHCKGGEGKNRGRAGGSERAGIDASQQTRLETGRRSSNPLLGAHPDRGTSFRRTRKRRLATPEKMKKR